MSVVRSVFVNVDVPKVKPVLVVKIVLVIVVVNKQKIACGRNFTR